ncbi:branched-chain amino acid ABC transporter permease [Aquabacterium sp. J223]|uniref:branched-chain amino acid ABC transporter permease n=1 Tax=Aquabacterium sp. J223 TaxID=2898431 RepID=UPI0021ADDE1C|nr:branched-chain amino acid ABC transporter permease [Aquabacterium sp. J223]UUX95244.1 branched-chain amino acid ABC transporter permease [Aquabacterium sp. J223]UUX96716.1 branched-chain amino acid ABC transporter permease [Aquabacterium sp. J223]
MKPLLLWTAGGVAVLAALPALLPAGLLNASIQMLIAALFACAYSLLSGRAGMLSFGHAAYFGAGAFATVHAMNALGGAGLLPTPLLPLVGAVVGLGVGLVAGWFATQRSGTTFAMITLAIAELLHALAPQLKGWFGGESGISSMRMPAWGFTFGSTTEVYYLTLAWVLVSLAALYWHALTPMGRLTLALRENAHRLRFLGYDVHGLGVSAFAISAMFSGVAGALQVVNQEAVNYVVFDAHVSASVVLNSYIGGVGSFLGPALGAAIMTFFGYAVSDATQSWLLYQGVLFVLVMMFMPAGLTGLVSGAARGVQRHGLAAVLPSALLWALAALLLAAGVVFTVELLQRLFSQDYRSLARMAGAAPPIVLFGRPWPPAAVATWGVPLLLLGAGAAVAWAARGRTAALGTLREPKPAAPAVTPGKEVLS